MNTYQRQLLDKLITELTDKPSPNLHAAQMLAAELKGAMQAQDAPQKPTTDADGWVKNRGVDPNCMIAAWRFIDGHELHHLMDSRELSWRLNLIDSDITHYRPA